MRIPTAKEIVENITRIAEQVAYKVALRGGKANIPAAYVSGNPTTQLPEETASTVGTRGDKVIVPYLAWGLNAPAASQAKGILRSSAGDQFTMGRLVDLADASMDAHGWASVLWAKPGDTFSFTAANTEQTNATTTYTTEKRFRIDRPGRFRVIGEISNGAAGAGSTLARVIVGASLAELNSSTDLIVASGEASSAAAHPSFTPFTLDMNVSIWGGWLIGVQIRDTTGAQTAYIKNVQIKYATATAAQTPGHFQVITD